MDREEGEEGKLQLKTRRDYGNFPIKIPSLAYHKFIEPICRTTKWQAKLFRILTKYKAVNPGMVQETLSGSLETKHTGLSVKLTSPKRMDGPRTLPRTTAKSR